MEMALGKLGLAMLLAVSMSGAVARPLGNWQDGESARLERQMKWAQASQARRGDDGQQDFGRDGGGRRGGHDGNNGGDDRFRNGPPRQDGYSQTPPDGGRRGGRMSPEDRRELRRQIDEAGRNIYAPGRR